MGVACPYMAIVGMILRDGVSNSTSFLACLSYVSRLMCMFMKRTGEMPPGANPAKSGTWSFCLYYVSHKLPLLLSLHSFILPPRVLLSINKSSFPITLYESHAHRKRATETARDHTKKDSRTAFSGSWWTHKALLSITSMFGPTPRLR